MVSKKPKPKPAEVDYRKLVFRLFLDADENSMALHKLGGADAQAKRLHELVVESEVVFNLVSVPGTVQCSPMHVTGSDPTRGARGLPRAAVAFSVYDLWFHVGFRLAYGDQDSDVYFRNCLLKAAPDGVERLARWLTPAGQEKAYFLRLGPTGDLHAHIELLALDRYHKTFEAQRPPA